MSIHRSARHRFRKASATLTAVFTASTVASFASTLSCTHRLSATVHGRVSDVHVLCAARKLVLLRSLRRSLLLLALLP
eukprot:5147298-Amphidinium_carterae.1